MMRMSRGHMKNEKNIFIIFAAALFFIVLSANIYSSIKSYRFRRLCNQYREQLIATTEANKELTDRIGRITEITGRIKETANANITNARDIAETVERLRAEIKEMEDCCGSFNQSEYYQYWDSYYHDEGLIE